VTWGIVAGALAAAAVVVLTGLVDTSWTADWRVRLQSAGPRLRWPVRIDDSRDKVLELVTALVAELEAGVPPDVALCNAAAVLEQPPCRSALRAVRVGGDVVDALRRDAQEPGCDGLRAVAACWQVSVGSGSGLSHALTLVLCGLRAEAQSRAALDGEVAGVRASARILALLPVLGVAVGAWTGAHPLGWLLSTGPGRFALVAGLLLQGVGMLWLRRIVGSAQGAV
jgi:tight adherence protein B